MEELDCSPTNRERELGLDRRETGWFYPPVAAQEVQVENVPLTSLWLPHVQGLAAAGHGTTGFVTPQHDGCWLLCMPSSWLLSLGKHCLMSLLLCRTIGFALMPAALPVWGER